MRIAVCGGPYANPYALAALIADARARGCERLFCLGDLGGFGAEINALWPLLREAGIECVAGNYDVAIARGDADCGCGCGDPRDNESAQLIYDHTRAHTSTEFAAWMGQLSTVRRVDIDGRDVHLVHGSTLALNDFWWDSLPGEQHRARRRRRRHQPRHAPRHRRHPFMGGQAAGHRTVLHRPPRRRQPAAALPLCDLDPCAI